MSIVKRNLAPRISANWSAVAWILLSLLLIIFVLVFSNTAASGQTTPASSSIQI